MAGSAIAIPMMPMPALTLPIHGIQPPERREALCRGAVCRSRAAAPLPVNRQLADTGESKHYAAIVEAKQKLITLFAANRRFNNGAVENRISRRKNQALKAFRAHHAYSLCAVRINAWRTHNNPTTIRKVMRRHERVTPWHLNQCGQGTNA